MISASLPLIVLNLYAFTLLPSNVPSVTGMATTSTIFVPFKRTGITTIFPTESPDQVFDTPIITRSKRNHSRRSLHRHGRRKSSCGSRRRAPKHVSANTSAQSATSGTAKLANAKVDIVAPAAGASSITKPGQSGNSKPAKTASSTSTIAPASTAANTGNPANSPASGPESAAQGSNGPSADTTGAMTGQATFYGTGLGACGVTNSDSDMIAAVSHTLFDGFPGASGNPNNNPICNRKVRAMYQGKSVTVSITDRCEGCAYGDLDFSPAAFNQLGTPEEGRLSGMTWQWV